MKTILLPTDFSENSLNAVRFAADHLAEEESLFILCFVYDIPHGGTSSLFTLMDQIREQAEKDMIELANQLKEQYKNRNIRFQSKVLQGDFSDQTNAVANDLNCDCIAICTKGASGVKEILIGSNAASIIRSTQKPIFVVPANYTKEMIQKVTISYDGNDLLAEDQVMIIDGFAKKHSLNVELLHVRQEDESPIQNWAEVEKQFDNHKISLTEVYGTSYEEGLKKAIPALKSLLVLIKRKKSFWENLINDSDSARVAKHFQIPLLVLAD